MSDPLLVHVYVGGENNEEYEKRAIAHGHASDFRLFVSTVPRVGDYLHWKMNFSGQCGCEFSTRVTGVTLRASHVPEAAQVLVTVEKVPVFG